MGRPIFVLDKNRFMNLFDRSFDRRLVERNRAVKKVNKNCIWSVKGKTIPLRCSIKLNYQLEIVGDESVNSIDLHKEFYVNLLFDRSIYLPMCIHIGIDDFLDKQ